jgi:hypothetical protein
MKKLFLLIALALPLAAQTPTDGTVKSFQKISDTAGGFTETLDTYDEFGFSIAALGDLDNDGVVDLVVGARYDDDGGANRGAVYVLFMQTDGTVKSSQKISDTKGSFTATLNDQDYFGSSVASIGDLDNDGITDLAVGAYGNDDGGYERGALYILFMQTDGTVKSYQAISDTAGSFSATLNDYDWFGSSVAGIGDIDNDGVEDLAVGAYQDDDGGSEHGAVYVLFMQTDGKVKSFQAISDTAGNFTAAMDTYDYFGKSVAGIGDLDNDGVEDLAVGAYGDDDGGDADGAVYVLFLQTDGTVQSYQKISDTEGNFTATLAVNDYFGWSVATPGDLDGDGTADLIVGAKSDEDGGANRGAVYILFMNTNGTVESYQKISDTAGNFTATLGNYDNFGSSATALGDLDGDGLTDLAVGAYGDEDGGQDRGAVYVLFLADAKRGPVAYYPFEGSARDTSGTGNHGTVYEAVLTADRFGNSDNTYAFDGTDDYVGVPYDSSYRPTEKMTLEVWFNIQSKGGYQVMASCTQGGGWSMQVNETDGAIFHIYTGSTDTILSAIPYNSIIEGDWYHFVGVYDGAFLKIYLNGTIVDSTARTDYVLYSWDNSFIVGAEAGQGSSPVGSYFNGLIDDVRIYNRALSAIEVDSLMMSVYIIVLYLLLRLTPYTI